MSFIFNINGDNNNSDIIINSQNGIIFEDNNS